MPRSDHELFAAEHAAIRRACVCSLVSALAVSCASVSPAPEPSAGASSAEARLPAGRGRAILQRSCIGCHDLGGLWAYQGYYDETRWRGLVDTMIAHGAGLNETEAAELVGYLVEHFGPGTR